MLRHRGNVRTSKFWRISKEKKRRAYKDLIQVKKNSKLSHACVPLSFQRSENEEELDHKLAKICRDKTCDTAPLFTLTYRNFFVADFSVGQRNFSGCYYALLRRMFGAIACKTKLCIRVMKLHVKSDTDKPLIKTFLLRSIKKGYDKEI